MRYSSAALVLATVAIGQVAAGPFQHVHHAHLHAKKAAELPEVAAPVEEKRQVDWATVSYTYSAGQTFGTATAAVADAPTTLAATPSSVGSVISSVASLLEADSATLTSLGCQLGINAASDNGGVFLGTGGTYQNEFTNAAGEPIILVVWGPDASWVNANKPLITVSLAAGESTTVSFASGSIGAWSAVYSDTIMVDGQVSNTWGEYTFSPEGVVDVSREVNMSGHSMSVVGPECTTDMDTCVFVCTSGNTCLTDYELLNCAAGSQSGAQYGTYGGMASGGCGGMGSSATFQTTFS